MRKTILTAAVIGLALSAGTGLASAQDAAPGATGGESAPGATGGENAPGATGGENAPGDAGGVTDTPVGCLVVMGQTEQICLRLDRPTTGVAGSIGYGSFGTTSLADLLSQFVLTGSNALSLELPIATGSYAPGSMGSYGPEAAIGELSAASAGSLVRGSLGS